jgi:hypothetical protein
MGALARLAQHLRRPAGPPVPFVVGVGRSGTTLLRLMLDAHPQLAVPPETGFVPSLIEAASEDSATVESLAEVLVTHRRWGDFGLEIDELTERWRALPKLRPEPVVRAFYELYADKQRKPRWGDKTPGYSQHIRAISKVIPEARFIHLIRDGRDVTLSRTTTLALKPTSVTKAAGRWKRRLKRARRQGRKVDHYLELRYEELASDPEGVLRRVCEFIELPWDPAMLAYHERSADRLQELDRDIPAMGDRLPRSAESRMALHERTTKPVDTSAIGKWRTGMSHEDLVEFETKAGDLLIELGYEPATSAAYSAATKNRRASE